MNYTLAGLTFTFTQNGSGMVTDITTPNIPVGTLVTIPSYVLHVDPATTVAGAELLVQGILGMLGLYP